MGKRILVTGGAGYVGSHTVLQLLLADFSVAVVDNLDNSSEAALERVAELAGDAGKNLTFHKVFDRFYCALRFLERNFGVFGSGWMSLKEFVPFDVQGLIILDVFSCFASLVWL